MPRRKRKSSPKKSRQPRAKPVRLNPDVWVRSGKSITDYRSSLLFEQEGLCAISGLPLSNSNSVLDHGHSDSGGGVDGKVRGVLQSDINMLEGRYLKLFKKAKLNERFGLTFAQLLINMGQYLQQDNSDRPYHFCYMTDLRKYISRLRKDQIELKLYKDFDIVITGNEDKRELVRMYMQSFVELVELKERRNK